MSADGAAHADSRLLDLLSELADEAATTVQGGAARSDEMAALLDELAADTAASVVPVLSQLAAAESDMRGVGE